MNLTNVIHNTKTKTENLGVYQTPSYANALLYIIPLLIWALAIRNYFSK